MHLHIVARTGMDKGLQNGFIGIGILGILAADSNGNLTRGRMLYLVAELAPVGKIRFLEFFSPNFFSTRRSSRSCRRISGTS